MSLGFTDQRNPFLTFHTNMGNCKTASSLLNPQKVTKGIFLILFATISYASFHFGLIDTIVIIKHLNRGLLFSQFVQFCVSKTGIKNFEVLKKGRN